jgi:hypothetical protein
MVNRYLVLLEFLVNSNSHFVFEFEGKIKFIAVTYYRYYTSPGYFPNANTLAYLSAVSVVKKKVL